jgi:hypothetical protein
MKMMFGKQSSGSRPTSKDTGAIRLPRSRGGRKRAALRTKDFWRALSSTALTPPHTPVLRRFHD